MTGNGMAALAVAFALTGCAPQEADYDLSERARSAPAPVLVPTTRFDAPLEAGIAAVGRSEDERATLAARAEALRTRGAAMSASAVVAPEARTRLERAKAPPDEATP